MKGMKESKEDATSEDNVLLEAPLSLKVIGHPLKVLCVLAVLLAVAGYWTFALRSMKDGMVFIPMDNGKLLKGFTASSDPTHEAMVFWCETCNIAEQPDFIRYRQEVENDMDNLRMKAGYCNDLEWSSVGKPMVGVKADNYVSADKTTAFVEIHASRIRCMLAVRKALKKYRRSTGDVLMSPGGPETVADASMTAEFRTALKHSIFAVPVCGLILWLVIGNVFRAGSPMLCVGAAYMTGKGIVGICKKCSPSLNVNFDDSCILFLVLALCVDYALFFWSRFNDERDRRTNPEGYRDALVAALHRSGTVIIISNCFVTLAYACTMLLPYLNIWAYLGMYIQAMGGCATAGLYSVTLTPALAVMFPSLFDHGMDPGEPLQKALWSRLPSPQNIWKAWARTITKGPLMFIIPLIAYGCMVPFLALVFWHYKPSFDSEVQGSRGDIIERQALARFESRFNLGQLYPVTLVLEAEPQGPLRPTGPADINSMLQMGWSASRAGAEPLALLSQQSWAESGALLDTTSNVALSLEFGNATCQLAKQIMLATQGKDCEVKGNDMLGLWWMPTVNTSGALGDHLCTVSHPVALLVSGIRTVRDPLRHIPLALKKQMPTVLQESLSQDGKRMLFKVMPSFRPTSPEAYSLDQVLREKILKENRTFTSAGQRYKLSVRHTSSMQVQVDASIGLGEAVPKVLGVFAPLVAIAIGISFCSVFLAFKLALTVIVPIITTYGMAIAVYQLGWLDGLGVEMFRESGGLDFRMMVLTAGILFGFAMDYDLFLFVRVYERRMEGYDNLSAVKRALVETGPVITTAGTMMVVSFFFIMCSHTVFLRTMGFIFTVGVLFDVYVVRTMIAPVFLSIGENLNYWPRKMPLATKKWE